MLGDNALQLCGKALGISTSTAEKKGIHFGGENIFIHTLPYLENMKDGKEIIPSKNSYLHEP